MSTASPCLEALLERESTDDAAFADRSPVGSLVSETIYTPIGLCYREVAMVHISKVVRHVPAAPNLHGRKRMVIAKEFVRVETRSLTPAEQRVAKAIRQHDVAGNSDPDTFNSLVSAWVASLADATTVTEVS
jgi:hypothetical protein